MNVVNVGCGDCWDCRFQHCHRQIAEPDDFLYQLAGGVIFAGQMALLVIEILGGISSVGFARTLTDRVVAVADGLPGCCVGGCDAPPAEL
ncbi:MAG: hypothetical protein QX199_05720 [Methylococcaceae bacterium]